MTTRTTPDTGGRLFAQAMRNARVARGVTQAELGAACGVDQDAIAHRESGQQPTRSATLASHARGLGISMRQLLLETVSPGLAPKTSDPDDQAALAQIVKNLRLRSGLTQAAFAERCGGLGQSMVAGIEAGTRNLVEDTIEKIADGLGLSMRDAVVVGLTWEAPPKKDAPDLAKLRSQLEAALAAGAKQQWLADKIGVSSSVLTRFKSGKSIGASAAENLAAALATL